MLCVYSGDDGIYRTALEYHHQHGDFDDVGEAASGAVLRVGTELHARHLQQHPTDAVSEGASTDIS